ncbi:MAG: LLM class F420-dependent oxidoreductase [Hyphomicrobiaceae bacterium]
MKFGLSTITSRVFTSPETYVAVASAAERAGFDFLSVSDHLIVPAQYESHYPYVAGGTFAPAQHGHCFDQLSTVAFLAAATSRLKLLTSVLVVPHRPAMLTAKMLATIDVLSNGRLIVGAGAGWMKEEFAALGANFPDRGAVTDESLAAFIALWTKERASFHGKHVNFDEVIFEPKPVQKPHPPLWIGGESPPAIRRAITYGTTWYPGNNSQTMQLNTAQRLASGIEKVRAQCEKAGRDPQTLGISLLVQDHFEWGDHKTADGSGRRMFTGSSDDMLADAEALGSIGVGHVALRLGGNNAREAADRIERFGAEVIARHKA